MNIFLYTNKYFTDMNIVDSLTENPLVSLIPFFTGIVFGFLICVLIYVFIVVKSFKKTEKLASNVVLNVDDKIIEGQIKNAKIVYAEESNYKTTAQKVDSLRNACWDLMNDIAKTYYPDSKYPLYELSIEEVLLLTKYITERLDKLFEGKVLKKVKNIKISTILKLVDIKKKYDQNKVVKTANKLHVSKGIKVAVSILNIFNPVYWVKKVMIDGTFNLLVNRIALTIIDVVGEETANVYSKNMFVKSEDEDKLINEIKEIEGMIEGDKDEK